MEPLIVVYVVLIVLNLRYWGEAYWLERKANRPYTDREYQALLKRKGLDRITYTIGENGELIHGP